MMKVSEYYLYHYDFSHFRIPKLISISRQTHEIDLEIGFASGCQEGEDGFRSFVCGVKRNRIVDFVCSERLDSC